ncbi:MAG: hypothetical protein ABSE84_23385 [Isosphaeraceae bacterium]
MERRPLVETFEKDYAQNIVDTVREPLLIVCEGAGNRDGGWKQGRS